MSRVEILYVSASAARQLRAEEARAETLEQQMEQLGQRYRQLQQQLAEQRQRSDTLLRLSARDMDPDRVESVLIPDELDGGTVRIAVSLAAEDEEEPDEPA